MEADYIGLLLAASAGYDPRLALKAFDKFPELPKYDKNSKLVVYSTTHPSRKKRAKVLARPRVMEEALTLYNDAREKRGG
jgi:metalloendopeptidase OMA1, mitochondrial